MGASACGSSQPIPDRFRAVVAANTGLPTGDREMLDAFRAWWEIAAHSTAFDIGRVIQNGTVTTLTHQVVAAYAAPFPDDASKAAARVFPASCPDRPDDPPSEGNREAWAVMREWHKPFLCLSSDSDPITAGADRAFIELVPGAEGQPHRTMGGAGHFLQEDVGEDLGEAVAGWLRGGLGAP